MSKKEKLTKGSATLPALGGFFLLVVLVIMIAPSSMNAYGIYDEAIDASGEVVSGSSPGVLNAGEFASCGDVINITATSLSPGSSSDRLVLDIHVLDESSTEVYSVTWGLNYTGTDDYYSGNITLDKTLSSNYQFNDDGYVGISLNVKDGYNVTLRNHTTENNILYHFLVDCDPPELSLDVNDWETSSYRDDYFAKPGGQINISISDTSSDEAWFRTTPHTQYTWNGDTWTNWTGISFEFPAEMGEKTLVVNATDEFGHNLSWNRTYIISEFLENETIIGSSKSYSNKTIVAKDINIISGGKLSFYNCTIVFDGEDRQLNVFQSGKLSITGPKNGSKSYVLSDDRYTIIAQKESDLLVNNTYMDAYSNPDYPSTFDISEGRIENVHIDNLIEKIKLGGNSPKMISCLLDLASPNAGIKVDKDHYWDENPVRIIDTVFNGTSMVPISIDETSIYGPYESETVYYADEDSIYNFTINHDTMTSPYVKIPYFVDSRSEDSEFTIRFDSGSGWTDISPTPISDETMAEWVNGEDAVINISTLPSPVRMSIMWNNTISNTGCAYIVTPTYGDMDASWEERSVNPTRNEWTEVKSPALTINNVTIRNATRHFIHMNSSGQIDISKLRIGEKSDFQSDQLIVLENATSAIHNSEMIIGKKAGTMIYSNFSAGNDWGKIHLYKLKLGAIEEVGHNISNNILIRGGSIKINDSSLSNATFGLKVDMGMVEIDNITADSGDYGVHWIPPSSFPKDHIANLNGVKTTYYNKCGILVSGNIEDYDVSMKLTDFSLGTSSNSYHTRSNKMGALVVDIQGDGEGDLTLGGSFSGGPGFGVAILEWMDHGDVTISGINGSGNHLDSVYYLADNELFIGESYIKTIGGYGLYLKDNTIAKTNKFSLNNCLGGVKTGNHSQVHMVGGSIRNITNNPGIKIGSNCEVDIEDVKLSENIRGISYGKDNKIDIRGCEITNSIQYGIYGKGSHLTIADNTLVQNSGDDGILLQNGSLEIKAVESSDNGGNGITLWNVEISEFKSITADDNTQNGISIYIGQTGLLHNFTYGPQFEKTTAIGNGMNGLSFSNDPTVINSPVDIHMSDPTVAGNGGYDFFSPGTFHFTWELFSGKIGSQDSYGMVRGNIDIIGEGVNSEFRNTNLTLLGRGNTIYLNNSAEILFDNCYITAGGSSNSYSIEQSVDSILTFSGSYLGRMERLEANEANLKMDDTLVMRSSSGLKLVESKFDITNCRFEDSTGQAIAIHGGDGSIIKSTFHQNSYGLWIQGLDSDLKLTDCRFTDNNWGIYIFNSNEMIVTIKDSYFNNNGISSIWADRGHANVIDSDLDLDSINVRSLGYNISIYNTLMVEVLDEKGEPTDYQLSINRGDLVEKYDSDDGDKYSEILLSYRFVFKDTLADDYSNVTVQMSYEDGSDSKSFILDGPTHIVFNGFRAPDKTSELPGEGRPIIMQEDIGGTVVEDATIWFDDTEEDRRNLTFTVTRITDEITPHLDGKRLWVSLEQDWFGLGLIRITATDPHGMSTSAAIPIFVEPTNDPPVASNPRIVVEGTNPPSSVAYSGDTIMGVWDFHDIDGDGEFPSSTMITWYRNGALMEELTGRKKIENVMAGQIWNYTLIPRDQNGSFGEPVHSTPIVVRNLAPDLEDVDFENERATTTDEIVALPINPSDPESETLIFHYLWEIKPYGFNNFRSVGAADSPILPPSFTSKGDVVRVRAWVSDGYADSVVRNNTIVIENSRPVIHSATFSPSVVDEGTQVIRVSNIEWSDADGDDVTFQYDWYVNGVRMNPISLSSEISKDLGQWVYPLRKNISVSITPYDSDNEAGKPYEMTILITPTDTDGDGLFDDANGNGINDGNDDRDDDNDGYSDLMETNQKPPTDPKDPFSKPLDTDGDGIPDGDSSNSVPEYMDLDDDNDGILDEQDSYPKNQALPGDLDGDGIGDDRDNDIDGDGVMNRNDWEPRNPNKWEEPEEPADITAVEWIILLVVFVILILAILAVLVYMGIIELPKQAPPTVSEEPDEGKEAIIQEGQPDKEKLDLSEIEEEELENLSVCSECGELIDIEEDKCPNCGAMFEGEDEFEE